MSPGRTRRRRPLRRAVAAAAAIGAILVAAAGCSTGGAGGAAVGSPTAAGAIDTIPTADLTTTVTRIVDGDTLYLADLDERMRLIGIDTPETRDPDTGVQCFGPEATRHLTDLVPPGTRVRVVWDVDRYDRYDRPLGYLYRASDGLFVNRRMVADGYATAFTVPPNVAHVDDFVAAQREARAAGRGLWSACRSASPSPTAAARASTAVGDSASADGASAVTITNLRYDGPGNDVQNGDGEYVEVHNGADTGVDLGGWSVTDASGHRIVVPSGYTVPADADLRIYTGPGDDTARRYYAGETQAIWNNSGGDTATLRDPKGAVVATYHYDS